MIDEKKYEGHAKEGWHFDSAHVLRDGYDKEIVELVGEDWLDDKATQELIADAPLLLAEVKKLREELNEVKALVLETYEYVQNTVAPFGWEPYLMEQFNSIAETLGLFGGEEE